MRIWTGIVMLVATTAFTPFQQPVTAVPTGATGLCKDGTYEMRAAKSGACSGHKGVKTWYAAKGATAKSAMMPAAAAPAKAAPTKPTTAPAPAPAMKPAPSTPPAMAATTPKAMSAKKTSSAASKTAAPGGGPGLVWVNSSSKIYHCLGSTEYGRTKKGSYMSEADAKAAGNRAARNKACAP